MTGCGFVISALVDALSRQEADVPAWAAALAVGAIPAVQNFILMTLMVFALPHPRRSAHR